MLRTKEQISKADVEAAWEEIFRGGKNQRKNQKIVVKNRLKKKTQTLEI